ncbi:Hypothetical protein CINCED_3A002048 [Cinara cedri]|uniref:Uncharacterized protein n=1 Tax=Cinara cedri TaxID=506608 RepID=A0A5E4MGF7_9HEMI|nr:Hypothetical protein CINCED_3A002048 [Cinara cedri]
MKNSNRQFLQGFVTFENCIMKLLTFVTFFVIFCVITTKTGVHGGEFVDIVNKIFNYNATNDNNSTSFWTTANPYKLKICPFGETLDLVTRKCYAPAKLTTPIVFEYEHDEDAGHEVV